MIECSILWHGEVLGCIVGSIFGLSMNNNTSCILPSPLHISDVLPAK